MNTAELKRFAQAARRKLLEQVGSKLSFVLTADSPELREKTQQIKQLREELNKTTKEQLIEKVSYTWFNRLMALRFMDANDYQPLGIRIITPKDGYTSPEFLDEAKRGNIPEELPVKKQRVFDLLDGKIPSTNPQNEAFKELLIAACNHLNSVLPFLFEKINDYSELLLPDDLTSDFSIVTNIREGMPVDDCKNVEIIGWLYQFYISEEKDRLINAKMRYKAHEIAPVTQLFTPKWIVQYMVDNTLGQLWKEARPKTNIIKDLEFYIKPEKEDIIPKRQLKSPEEISFFDPCVGSGHILCYAFDIFYRIYQEEGYNDFEIPEFIITKNLVGIDIDERAAQLAGFALMMKGREHDRRLLRKSIVPNIISFKNNSSHPKFNNAETFGSLIRVSQDEIKDIKIEKDSIFSEQERYTKNQALFLSKVYDIVVTNPPYLNAGNMEGNLKQYVEKHYKTTKSDLFACFLLRVVEFIKTDGIVGFICPYVWMFIQTYEKLREKIIDNTTINSLIQLEYNAFEPAVVPICTFTFRKIVIENYIGKYIRLSDFKGVNNQHPKTLQAIKDEECGWMFKINQQYFKKIPSLPLVYWLPKIAFDSFSELPSLRDIIKLSGNQNKTGYNEKYLRFHWEVNNRQINNKWILYSKGGDYRKWYGNIIHVIDWSEKAIEFYRSNPTSNLLNREYWFRQGITFTELTTRTFNARFLPSGCIYDMSGPAILFEDTEDLYYYLAFLNCRYSEFILNLLNPTFHYKLYDLERLPVLVAKERDAIIQLSTDNYNISKRDWDAKETSCDFAKCDIINHIQNGDIQQTIDSYELFWRNKFLMLKKNEELLNEYFITDYGLKEHLESEVPYENLTILQDEVIINDGQVTIQTEEVVKKFISYSIGCIFGRYSLDKERLVIANQEETLEDYLHKIGKSLNECIFLPDEDNIIPILDDAWFEDDIVGKFNRFLKVTFGEKNFSKNIAIIEEQIGKDLRKYFIRDFYTDHIKRFKKRPIYWMFSSPKGSFNVLIYMHRYTPNTVSNILNKYLKEFIGKLNARKENLQHVQVTGSASEKTKAIKEIAKIDKMLVELHEYERDILYPLATERIEIDLDDGVLVNYNKFGRAVKEVNGLNDPATKKKVKEFDWIETTQIR